MKASTTLSILFASAITCALMSSDIVTDQQPVMNKDIVACAWYPLCTDPDIYSPNTADDKEQADTTDSELSVKFA